MKKRFQVIDTAPKYSYEYQGKLIIVLCALLNFIRFWAYGVDEENNQEAHAEFMEGERRSRRVSVKQMDDLWQNSDIVR